jgi:hypothetical protein
MDVAEMRARIAEKRHKLKINSAGMVFRSKDGPIGIDLIEDLLELIETHERRIEDLEKRISTR